VENGKCGSRPPHPHLYWSAGPGSPDYHLLRIDPWRVQVLRGSDLSSRIWAADPPPHPDPPASG
jgi:hypothetical protein